MHVKSNDFKRDFYDLLDLFILGGQRVTHSYTSVANKLNSASLVDRSVDAGLKFSNGLLDEKIDSPYLLSLINFKVPQRNSRYFCTPISTTNYLLNDKTCFKTPLRTLIVYFIINCLPQNCLNLRS